MFVRTELGQGGWLVQDLVVLQHRIGTADGGQHTEEGKEHGDGGKKQKDNDVVLVPRILPSSSTAHMGDPGLIKLGS